MRALTVGVLIALMSALAHAQTRSMASATHALKGPVRTFRTEVATFVLKDGVYVEGPRVLLMEASFNRDGNRTDFRSYNRKGELARRIVMTFEGRRMIEAINYDGAGKMWLRIVNVYDEEGQVKERASYNNDGSLSSKTDFKRNNKGQVIESSEYSAEGILMEETNNKYQGRDLQVSERKIYDATGSLRSTEVYEAPNKQTTITWNRDGSVASKSVRVNQEISHYGPDGSFQKATMISRDRLLDEVMLNQDGSTKRESQVPDEVDAYENWTKQTKWLTDSKGTRPLKITYRQITYYEKFTF